MNRNGFSYSRARRFEQTVEAAQNFISLYHQIPTPSDENQSTLATAHYTLAQQQDIPLSHCKMHTNATITLLQNIKDKDSILTSLMANAYFRRAGFFESENALQAAEQDYQRAFQTFEEAYCMNELDEEDLLSFAQSAISIADLLLLQKSYDYRPQKNHPLYYVNKALEYLSQLSRTNEDRYLSFAYAHHVAGLALSSIDTKEAKEAFRTALTLSFKADPLTACGILGDIYNSLGLIYEQQYRDCIIQKKPNNINDHAIIYFAIALFFNPSEDISLPEQRTLLDHIFETIYRALDPFLTPLSPTVLRDFIDALIFAYYCVSDKILPNKELCNQLQETETFNTFAQHIFWLVAESFRRENHQHRLLEMIELHESDLILDLGDSLKSLLQGKNKVFYLNKNETNEKISTEII